MSEKEKNAPAVSVLLPVNNAGRYLVETLDSLLAQTFTDFEIIAINDGSKDFSGKILNEYAIRDFRIRVFHRPQRGLVASLNEGVALVRGEWIARMDADDIAHPRRFELQIEQLVRTGADFCGGTVMCFGASRAIWRYPHSNELCGVQLLFNVPVAHPAVMGRTKAFATLRYDPNFKHAEDYDLWQRAWVSGYLFTNISDVVLYYRTHSEQISGRHQSDQQKMANLVRARHWAALCPDLKNDWFRRNMDKFCPSEGGSISLMKGMYMTLLYLPENTHTIFLDGCLRILLRKANIGRDHISHWFKICRSAKERSWRLKVYGLCVLFLFLVFRIKPRSYIYRWLRTTQKKVVKH